MLHYIYEIIYNIILNMKHQLYIASMLAPQTLFP
jgi:hypothetical protein